MTVPWTVPNSVPWTFPNTVLKTEPNTEQSMFCLCFVYEKPMGSKRAQEYSKCWIKDMIPTRSIICMSPQLTLTDNLMSKGPIKIRIVYMIFENLT